MSDTVNLLNIADCFALEGTPVCCAPFGSGHICHTYAVNTDAGKRYILQRMNEVAFKNIDGLMNNIALVTEHLRSKTENGREVMQLVPLKNGSLWLKDDSGCWRVYEFAEDTLCLQAPESAEDFYQSAVGFGRFQQLLSDFPAEKLIETIPDFHNTPNRYRIFREVLKKDAMHRAADVRNEIEAYLGYERQVSQLHALRESGVLPTRVTHNDTKLNNVLLDAKTRKALCVIDLDTVMPGLSLYDYGDAIRFGASTADESEKDLSKVNLNMDYFRAFTRGYLEACPSLTKEEINLMPLGAITMTVECGLRFLTDYLDGDNYFSVSYDTQNLDRCRTQLRFADIMTENINELNSAVQEEAGSIHVK